MSVRVSRDHATYAFEPDMSPATTVPAGETVALETSDCYDGQVSLEADCPGDAGIEPGRGNPATGPVYVEGAAPGDTLVAHIEAVSVASRGLLFGNDRHGGNRFGGVVRMVDGHALLPGGFRQRVEPVVGVVGVATEAEVVPNTTPGDHGGNLDTPDIRAGASVHLPVFQPGALFGVGDLHALQGDGEVCGQGVEVAGEVVVRLEIMKGAMLRSPLILTRTHWAVLASAPDLDEAVEMALLRARDFIMFRAGVRDQEAMMLLSCVCDVRISQIVNPLRTVRVCIPRKVAGGPVG